MNVWDPRVRHIKEQYHQDPSAHQYVLYLWRVCSPPRYLGLNEMQSSGNGYGKWQMQRAQISIIDMEHFHLETDDSCCAWKKMARCFCLYFSECFLAPSDDTLIYWVDVRPPKVFQKFNTNWALKYSSVSEKYPPHLPHHEVPGFFR